MSAQSQLTEFELRGGVTAFRHVYFRVTGNVMAALLLSQIAYWHRPGENGKSRLRIYKKDQFWVAKKRTDWLSECGLTSRQYDAALGRLTKLGVVETKIFHFNGYPTTHVRIVYDRLLELCNSVEGPLLNDANGDMEIPQSVIPYTETTGREHKAKAKSGVPAVQVAPAKMDEKADATAVVGPATPPKKEQEPRLIWDWVADRPGLAEQKLRFEYSATEWKMKAEEILKRHREKDMPAAAVRQTANSLAMLWKRTVANKYNAFVKEFTQKEMGQVRLFLKAVGESSPTVMEYTLLNWNQYVVRVKDEKGLASAPERPVIGFVLKYLDVAVNQYERSLQSIAEPAPVGFDKAEDILHTEAETPATLDEVMEILSGLK